MYALFISQPSLARAGYFKLMNEVKSGKIRSFAFCGTSKCRLNIAALSPSLGHASILTFDWISGFDSKSWNWKLLWIGIYVVLLGNACVWLNINLSLDILDNLV